MYNNQFSQYNPYQRYQNNVQTQQLGLNGKQVENYEVAKNMDIVLDGSISYFPLLDNSKIITKQLQTDGTIKTLIYSLDKETKAKENNYISLSEVKKMINDLEIDDLKEEIDLLKKKLKKSKE